MKYGLCTRAGKLNSKAIVWTELKNGYIMSTVFVNTTHSMPSRLKWILKKSEL